MHLCDCMLAHCCIFIVSHYEYNNTWCQKYLKMASYHISSMEQLSFSKPEKWLEWITQFECFRQASGIASKPEQSQVNLFIYSIGQKAEFILIFQTVRQWWEKLQEGKRKVWWIFYGTTKQYSWKRKVQHSEIRRDKNLLIISFQTCLH